MKRDMLLCAEIIRNMGDGNIAFFTEAAKDEAKANVINYHVRLLKSGGFIAGNDALTMSGWDFYAYATRPDFKAVHDEILRIIGGVPYPLLTEMLDDSMKARRQVAPITDMVAWRDTRDWSARIPADIALQWTSETPSRHNAAIETGVANNTPDETESN